MVKNFIISFLIATNIITAVFCIRLNYRLEQNRQLIEHYRVELECAKDRESDIAESIRRTSEILSSSVSTLSGLRAQIAEIRKSYEKMESLLYNTGSNDIIDNNITNYSNEEMK